MGIMRAKLVCTTDGSGAGTAVSEWPVIGEILEIRQASAAWGATADYTITRSQTGGTVCVLTDAAGPFTVYPRGNAVTTANAGGTAIVPIPSDEMLRLVVAQATVSTAGTVHVYYEA